MMGPKSLASSSGMALEGLVQADLQGQLMVKSAEPLLLRVFSSVTMKTSTRGPSGGGWIKGNTIVCLEALPVTSTKTTIQLRSQVLKVESLQGHSSASFVVHGLKRFPSHQFLSGWALEGK